MGAGGGADEPLLVGAQRQAVRVADGLPLRVQRDRLAAGLAVEADAGEAAGDDPAAADVGRRDRVGLVGDEREVGVLAVGGDLHPAEVDAGELLVEQRLAGDGVDDGDAAVAAGADREPRAVGRQGEVVRPAPHRDARRFLEGVQVDDGDRRGRGQGDVSELAVGGDGDAARLEAEPDAAGAGERVAFEVEGGQLAGEGAADEGAAAVGRQGQRRGALPAGDLGEELAVVGAEQRDGAGGLVGGEDARLVGRQDEVDGRTVNRVRCRRRRFLGARRRGGRRGEQGAEQEQSERGAGGPGTDGAGLGTGGLHSTLLRLGAAGP